MAELLQILDDLATQSHLLLWLNCLVKPVLMMMSYRESDWPLHLNVVEVMLPLFFAAGYVHYASYSLYYLRSMLDFPGAIQEKIIKGQRMMHHTPGIFSGIWP